MMRGPRGQIPHGCRPMAHSCACTPVDHPSRPLRSRAGLWLMAAIVVGCGSRTGLEGLFARGTGGAAGATAPVTGGSDAPPPFRPPGQAAADRIDLLFVIDDSGSMADKQNLLADAIPDLV